MEKEAAAVVLPTPPLPEDTQTILPLSPPVLDEPSTTEGCDKTNGWLLTDAKLLR